jgi:hypothetical protein
MTDPRGILSGIAAIFAIWLIVTLVVVGLSAIMPPREQRQTQAEIDFRVACTSVGGKAAHGIGGKT